MTQNNIVPIAQTDMIQFDKATIERAGKLLGCALDEQSILKALIIQQDTGLSIARGEISVVPFAGKPTVFINKQGYLAYAARHPQYDGYESDVEGEGEDMVAWCSVYRKDHSRPTKVKVLFKEFGKSSPVWKQMPRHMLEKTAISLALRSAFPALNGTLTEEEVGLHIEPRETDIIVEPVEPSAQAREPAPTIDAETTPAPTPTPTPAPAPTPAAVPERRMPSKLYSLEEAQTILENMTAQGLEFGDLFENARIDSMTFDGDMINAEFKRLRDEAKAARQTAPSQTAPVCAECGKKVLPTEVEKSTAKHGIPLCRECLLKRDIAQLTAKKEE